MFKGRRGLMINDADANERESRLPNLSAKKRVRPQQGSALRDYAAMSAL